jgi:hypothetical protein
MTNCYLCHHPVSSDVSVELIFRRRSTSGHLYLVAEHAHEDCIDEAKRLFMQELAEGRQ